MDGIVNRIKDLLESRNLSASEFADLIGVKRANVSHVLSGRNKPSLEFVIRLSEAFEEIDLNTLLLTKASSQEKDSYPFEKDKDSVSQNKLMDAQSFDFIKGEDEIERIILFFKDGSFKEYNNNDNT